MESINVELITNSPEETQDIGRILGEHALPGQIFLLIGDLGVGKTCISQGVLWGLGGEEYATSPTFVLVSEYKARLTMHHIDLYRVGSSEDMIELGLEENSLSSIIKFSNHGLEDWLWTSVLPKLMVKVP